MSEKHVLISGEILDLSQLTNEEKEYLQSLSEDAKANNHYFDILRRVKLKGAFPLRGGAITTAIARSIFYRVANDIADRIGIKQGFLRKP